VIVGPNLNKADLEKKLTDLKKLTKVQGKLARFKVTN
jgi:DedD protein